MATRISTYFRESYHELKKVAWPTRKEVYQNTVVVIVISLVVAVFLGLLDFLFAWALEFIL